MSSQDSRRGIRVAGVVLLSVVVLALGIGLQSPSSGDASASSAVTAPPVNDGPSVNSDASVVVETGVVKFYFASGLADLPAAAVDALTDSVAAAQAGKRLVISGFHDATGDAAFNAELAKRRAVAVRDTLMSAGVAESSIELKKPEQTTGSGNDAEARRVEVMTAD